MRGPNNKPIKPPNPREWCWGSAVGLHSWQTLDRLGTRRYQRCRGCGLTREIGEAARHGKKDET